MDRPTTEVVAAAWLRDHVVGCPFATTLPERSQWEGDVFGIVSVVGGAPHPDFDQRQPVIQVDIYAAQVRSSGRPLWGKANQYAELARSAMYGYDSHMTNVVLPANYSPARVQSLWPLTEPRRIPDPEGSYGRYQFDAQCVWVVG